MDLSEIDDIVFNDTQKAPIAAVKKVNSTTNKESTLKTTTVYDNKTSPAPSNAPVNQSKVSSHPYEEEESYENPVNLSKATNMKDEYVDIRSDYVNNGVNMSIGMINQSMLQDNDGQVHLSNLNIDENAQDSYQVGKQHSKKGSIVKNRILDPSKLGGPSTAHNKDSAPDSQNNTIKLVKEDIVIGGQVNPNVKITRQGK